MSQNDEVDQTIEKKIEYLAEKPETPGQGCKLRTYRYHFEMLEPEMVTQVSVPFAQINDEVDSFVAPPERSLFGAQCENKTEATSTSNSNDDNIADEKNSASACKTTKLQHVLDEFGFAIIPDLLSTNLELETLRSLFSQDLLSIIAKPPISDAEKFADVASDPINRWPQNLSLGHTFCSDFGLVHGRLAWHVRCHPKIKSVFSTIYDGDQNLCTGMDNLFYSNTPADPPLWEVEKSSDPEENEATIAANRYGDDMWPHCDQNLQELPSGAFKIYQSALYVNETNDKTSTTVVWPRSHREITPKVFDEKRFIMGHYCPLPDVYKGAFLRNCRRIPVPAGGLLIWNSRTQHQGWENGPRLAVPVCLEPKARRDQKSFDTKTKLVLKGQPSTHWASKCVPHDLGYFDKPRERDGLTVLHRAHLFLLANSDKPGQIPKDIVDMF